MNQEGVHCDCKVAEPKRIKENLSIIYSRDLLECAKYFRSSVLAQMM